MSREERVRRAVELATDLYMTHTSARERVETGASVVSVDAGELERCRIAACALVEQTFKHFFQQSDD